MPLKKLVAGNWKMHGVSSDIAEIQEIAAAAKDYSDIDVALCVPAILIERAARAVPGFSIGGQDVHHAEKGAHTGCTSAAMLHDAGASLTIVGHSERRDAQRESDEEVKAKAEAALAVGLEVILCVGESLELREKGDAVPVVTEQLDGSLPAVESPTGLAIAYEPIWAIGTGKIPTVAEIAEMHQTIRLRLRQRYGEPGGGGVRILYGGSVKASNAAEIFGIRDVDGALVGGASLKAADFIPIVAAASGR